MLPCVPHLINIARGAGSWWWGGEEEEEEREGCGGQVKLCLPRKASSLAKSQLSRACAKQIAERGRGTPGGPRASTGSREPGARNTGEHTGGRLSGRSGGGRVPFVRCPGPCHGAVPRAGPAPGSRRACQSPCQERVPPQRQTPQRPGPPRPRDVEDAHADLRTMLAPKFAWFVRTRKTLPVPIPRECRRQKPQRGR